jgi:hypothetical protein
MGELVFFFGEISMLKILEVVFSFVLDQFFGIRNKKAKTSISEIVMMTYHNAQRIFSSIAFAVLGSVMALTGFFVASFNLLGQWDQYGMVSTGAVASGGGAMVLIGGGFIWYASRKRDLAEALLEKIGDADSRGEGTQAQQASPLEAALSVLVLDFVKEREAKREARQRVENAEQTDFDPWAEAPEVESDLNSDSPSETQTARQQATTLHTLF